MLLYIEETKVEDLKSMLIFDFLLKNLFIIAILYKFMS